MHPPQGPAREGHADGPSRDVQLLLTTRRWKQLWTSRQAIPALHKGKPCPRRAGPRARLPTETEVPSCQCPASHWYCDHRGGGLWCSLHHDGSGGSVRMYLCFANGKVPQRAKEETALDGRHGGGAGGTAADLVSRMRRALTPGQVADTEASILSNAGCHAHPLGRRAVVRKPCWGTSQRGTIKST